MPTMTTNNVPNLDCMTTGELRAFAVRHEDGARAALLFPNDQGAGAIATTHRLAVYARYKAEAQVERVAGRINTALLHEDVCERIYRALPDDVRW